MAPSKKSRKGKKEWRKNIDTSEVEAQIEQANTDARRGPGVETLQDDQLFVLDTEPNQQTLTKISKRRKKEAKPLRSQLVLDSIGQGIQAVNPSATKHKQKGQLVNKRQQSQPEIAVVAAKKPKQQKAVQVADVWEQPASTSGAADFLPELLPTAYKASTRKHRSAHVPAAPLIPAVEIDHAGCSYNPDKEQHQDAVALLVAQEMKKVLAQELAPKAPPAEADADYKRLSELEQLLVDAEQSDEEDAAEEQQPKKKRRKQQTNSKDAAADAQQQDQEASSSEDDDDDAGTQQRAARASGKKTKQERNREAKRKAVEAQLSARKDLKKQRRDLEALKALQAELAEQEAEQAVRRQRRAAVAAEKAASQPPRLGKQKFEPEPVQVLTSDELTGSLRQLQPCFTVAKDRFKALQKRGMVEVRAPRAGKKGRKVAYEHGARAERAAEGQAELEDMRRKRVAAERAARGKQQLG